MSVLGPDNIVSPEWDNFLPLRPSLTDSPDDLRGIFSFTASSPSDEVADLRPGEIAGQPNLSTIHEVSADNTGRVTEVVSMEGSHMSRKTSRLSKPPDRLGF